ncbi:hypothetical protein ACFQRB_18220 [Halobaculum litoreum]|uniref:DUF7837 domain-containing protein n=1 Tax=Halobaculum litoreum TaxID=3031998 RepID=A0ABD5XRT0_9EURY
MGSRGDASDTLGTCPVCGRSLPAHARLVTYHGDGWPTLFAECADCDEIVHPR